MPTVFEKISGSLSGNDLDVRLVNQVSSVLSVGTMLKHLIENPPAEIGDLVEGLKDISIPQTDFTGDLQGAITSLKSLIPENLDDVTGNLATRINELSVSIGDEITGTLNSTLEAYRCLSDLLQMISGNGGPDESGSPSMSRMLMRQPAAAVASPAGAPEASFINLVGSAEFSDDMSRMNDLLNSLPAPFHVENLLQWLSGILNNLPRTLAPTSYVPFIDEFQQTLQTMHQWKTSDGAQIGTNIESTLLATAALIHQSTDSVVLPIETTMNTMGSILNVAALKNVLESLSLELQSLATAVNTSNFAQIDTVLATLNSLDVQLSPILLDLHNNFFSGQSGSLIAQLQDFPVNLEGAVAGLLARLNPVSDAGLLQDPANTLNSAFRPEQAASFAESIGTSLDWLKKVLELLDLSVIEGPIADAATGARAAVDGLDDILIGIVTQVSLLFDEVETILNQVDTQVIIEAVEKSLDAFQQLLQNQIDSLFAPIRDAITTIIGSIDSAADAFDPEDIIDALRDAIQSISGVMTDPQITGLLDNIKNTLNRITEELDSVAFKPVNDLVIGQIEAVTATLKTIDTSGLNNALKLTLMAALELLPQDDVINSLKDKLTGELNVLIDTGPVPLLTAVRKQPNKIIGQLQNYSPANLVGDQLSIPFQKVIGELEAFKPSHLLEPVQQALDEVKTNLSKNVNPASLFEPLEAPFDELLGAFNTLKPQDLVAPLQQQIDSMVDTVLDAVPAEELIGVVDAVLDKIAGAAANLQTMKTLIEKVLTVLQDLNNPDEQVAAWIAGILAKVDQIPGTINLASALAQISAGIDNIKAQSLRNRLVIPLESFVQNLTTLQPGGEHSSLVRSYRDFPHDVVDSLPDPHKQKVKNFLESFNPLDGRISGPLRGLQDLLNDLIPKSIAVTDFLEGWDGRYHGPNSPFQNCLITGDVNIESLRNEIKVAIENNIKNPLTAILQVISYATQFLESILQALNQFISDIQTPLTNLVSGPDSLGAIRDALDGLIDKIRNFNLNFLVVELESVFDTVKAKLDPINPNTIKGLVEADFNLILANLDITKLMPQDQIATLDADFQKLIDKLKKLDPKILVTDLIQPEFDEMIQPYLEAFDLTAFIEALIARLESLKEELAEELERTCQAFREMVDAVPSIEISIDIDVDVGGIF